MKTRLFFKLYSFIFVALAIFLQADFVWGAHSEPMVGWGSEVVSLRPVRNLLESVQPVIGRTVYREDRRRRRKRAEGEAGPKAKKPLSREQRAEKERRRARWLRREGRNFSVPYLLGRGGSMYSSVTSGDLLFRGETRLLGQSAFPPEVALDATMRDDDVPRPDWGAMAVGAPAAAPEVAIAPGFPWAGSEGTDVARTASPTVSSFGDPRSTPSPMLGVDSEEADIGVPSVAPMAAPVTSTYGFSTLPGSGVLPGTTPAAAAAAAAIPISPPAALRPEGTLGASPAVTVDTRRDSGIFPFSPPRTAAAAAAHTPVPLSTGCVRGLYWNTPADQLKALSAEIAQKWLPRADINDLSDCFGKVFEAIEAYSCLYSARYKRYVREKTEERLPYYDFTRWLPMAIDIRKRSATTRSIEKEVIEIFGEWNNGRNPLTHSFGEIRTRPDGMNGAQVLEHKHHTLTGDMFVQYDNPQFAAQRDMAEGLSGEHFVILTIDQSISADQRNLSRIRPSGPVAQKSKVKLVDIYGDKTVYMWVPGTDARGIQGQWIVDPEYAPPQIGDLGLDDDD